MKVDIVVNDDRQRHKPYECAVPRVHLAEPVNPEGNERHRDEKQGSAGEEEDAMSFHNTFDDAAMTLKFQKATLLLKCHYSLDECVDSMSPTTTYLNVRCLAATPCSNIPSPWSGSQHGYDSCYVRRLRL